MTFLVRRLHLHLRLNEFTRPRRHRPDPAPGPALGRPSGSASPRSATAKYAAQMEGLLRDGGRRCRLRDDPEVREPAASPSTPSLRRTSTRPEYRRRVRGGREEPAGAARGEAAAGAELPRVQQLARDARARRRGAPLAHHAAARGSAQGDPQRGPDRLHRHADHERARRGHPPDLPRRSRPAVPRRVPDGGGRAGRAWSSASATRAVPAKGRCSTRTSWTGEFEDLIRDRDDEQKRELLNRWPTERDVAESKPMIRAKAQDMLEH